MFSGNVSMSGVTFTTTVRPNMWYYSLHMKHQHLHTSSYICSCESWLHAKSIYFLFLFLWCSIVSLHSGITGAAWYQQAWSPTIKGLMWRWKSILVWSCSFHDVWAKWQHLSVCLEDQHSCWNSTVLCKRGARADCMDNSSVRESDGQMKIKRAWVLLSVMALRKGTINLPAEKDQRLAKPTAPPNTQRYTHLKFSLCSLCNMNFGTKSNLY